MSESISFCHGYLSIFNCCWPFPPATSRNITLLSYPFRQIFEARMVSANMRVLFRSFLPRSHSERQVLPFPPALAWPGLFTPRTLQTQFTPFHRPTVRQGTNPTGILWSFTCRGHILFQVRALTRTVSSDVEMVASSASPIPQIQAQEEAAGK
jgi:hypothetical protein